MKQQLLTILGIFVVATICIQQTAAVCNVCQANGIACVNQTAYQFCTNGAAATAVTIKCPKDTYCTDLDMKCSPNESQSSCVANASSCGVCISEKLFTCTSRRTFAQCNGNTQMDVTGTCPTGYVCHISNDYASPCVRECAAPNKLACDL